MDILFTSMVNVRTVATQNYHNDHETIYYVNT